MFQAVETIQKKHEAILNGDTLKAFGLDAEARALGLLDLAGHTLTRIPYKIRG